MAWQSTISNKVPAMAISGLATDDPEGPLYDNPAELSVANGTPSQPFDSIEDDLENGFVIRSSQHRKNWWKRLINMPYRKTPRIREQEGEREEGEEVADDNGEDEGNRLLTGTNGTTHDKSKLGRSRTGYNWRIFGKNTAIIIMGLLLMLDLPIGIAYFSKQRENQDPFANWGKPGTESEGLSWYPTDFLRDVIPIRCHSHNDYWRRVPLFSALYNGCISIEADVWSFDDELYVGHNTASLTANRTFQSLYIFPLVEILERQNPKTEFYNDTFHGVFDTDPEQHLTLLVDVKTNGEETWPFVLRQLEPLRKRGWLTFVENDVLHRRAITVVGTGDTPFNLLTANQTYRDAFFDAPLDTMFEESPTTSEADTRPLPSAGDQNRRGQGNEGTSPTDSYTELNSFYASTSFNDVIGRIWWGKLSEKQIQLLRGLIKGAHKRGLKARFWDQPAWPVSLRNHLWDVLIEEGADILNVDDLKAVRKEVW